MLNFVNSILSYKKVIALQKAFGKNQIRLSISENQIVSPVVHGHKCFEINVVGYFWCWFELSIFKFLKNLKCDFDQIFW
jgi:hypothetical protein